MLRAERARDELIVYLTGELDHCAAPMVRRELDALILDPGVRRLVLDMSGMGFMDSSGIGVLLGRFRFMAARGGTVAVRHMNAQVRRVFCLSGMQTLMCVE